MARSDDIDARVAPDLREPAEEALDVSKAEIHAMLEQAHRSLVAGEYVEPEEVNARLRQKYDL